MTDIFKDLEKEADALEEEKSQVDLGPLSRLVQRQARLEAQSKENTVNKLVNYIKQLDASVKDVEQALKARKRDLFNISQVQIPELMKEIGLESITTTDGSIINLKKDFSTTIKNEEGFFKYLRDNNYGDLIKDKIAITIQSEKEVKLFEKLIDQVDCFYERKTGVHPQTLKKFVNDQLAEGNKIPEDLLKIYEYQFSKLS